WAAPFSWHLFSAHRPQRLHRNHGRNFQGRKDHYLGEKGFEQPAQMKARRGGTEKDGRGLRHLISREQPQAIENAADEGRLQSGAGGGRGLWAEGAAEFLFECVIQS